ncbi:MAG: hypothetical protein WAW17_26325 [Rhodococcus sp. (in: high G+C Gram-positive bacteria)]
MTGEDDSPTGGEDRPITHRMDTSANEEKGYRPTSRKPPPPPAPKPPPPAGGGGVTKPKKYT